MTRARMATLASVAAISLATASCGREEAATAERAGSTGASLAGLSAAARAGDTAARRALTARQPPRPQLPPASDSGPLGVHRPAELDTAARQIVGFLQGRVDFDRIRLADTVTLYIGREAGGTSVRFARAQLRNRSVWRVRGGRATYALAPPATTTNLTTRVGRHFSCLEQALSWTFPELARLPHVATKLEPPDASSCLQTWNVTFVFDPSAKPPTLVAAVYDQFEW